MLERLQQLVADASQLNSKLVVVVSNSGSGKTAILTAFAQSRDLQVINVGRDLSKNLVPITSSQRSSGVMGTLQDLISDHRKRGEVVLDNIEVMFDAELRMSPFDALKRLAHAVTVIVAWPGNFRDGRLHYAKPGHPEHCDVGIDGAIVLELN